MENRIFECIKLLSYLYFKLKVNFKHNIFNSCIDIGKLKIERTYYLKKYLDCKVYKKFDRLKYQRIKRINFKYVD